MNIYTYQSYLSECKRNMHSTELWHKWELSENRCKWKATIIMFIIFYWGAFYFVVFKIYIWHFRMSTNHTHVKNILLKIINFKFISINVRDCCNIRWYIAKESCQWKLIIREIYIVYFLYT